jgi:hypothetical protein
MNTGSGNAVVAQIDNPTNDSTVLFAGTNGSGRGITALISSVDNNRTALTGTTNGIGTAVLAQISNLSSNSPAMNAETEGTGNAVLARIINVTNANPAIDANTNGTGVAIVASGGRAQLRLVPDAATGAPTSGLHQQGEVFTDTTGSLFHCKEGDGSDVGTWLRVGYNPVDPARIVDTRAGAPPVSHGDTPLDHGDELVVDIIGVAGIPVGASAVTLNVTAVGPTNTGFMSLYPAHLGFTAGSPPSFSSLNFVGGPPSAAVANLATVKIATTGENAGKIKVFNFGGAADVLLDVAGFFS